MVIIVGAGLAGLCCAKNLHKAGIDFLLLEAAAEPGGRVRHTQQDGFVLDRGFQVIIDSFTAVRQEVDIPALQPRYFDAGALIWDQGTFFEMKSPLQHPGAVFSDLSTPAFPFADKVRFATIVSSTLVSSDHELLAKCHSAEDESTLDYLRRLGCGDELLRRFIQPFFGGVFQDEELKTSKGLFWFYLKKFATGRAFVPAGGVGDLPKQLCAELPQQKVRFGTKVASVEYRNNRASRVVLGSGERLTVDTLILATEEPATRKLLGTGNAPRPHNSVSVVYFASDEPLYDQKLLVLPAGEGRLVRHFVQLSNVAPEYSPAGQHLLSATVLDPRGLSEEELGRAAALEINEVFPGAAARLKPLAAFTIPYSTLQQPAGFAAAWTPPPLPENIFLAGDQVSSSSIDAAMHSGQQAATAYLSPRN